MEKEKDNSKLHRKLEEGTYSERELEPHENEVRIKTHEEGNRTIFPKTQVLEKTFENKLKKKKINTCEREPFTAFRGAACDPELPRCRQGALPWGRLEDSWGNLRPHERDQGTVSPRSVSLHSKAGETCVCVKEPLSNSRQESF